MTGTHVVFGAGVIGRGVAAELVRRDEAVLLVSRSGQGPAVSGAVREAADASDPDQVSALTADATAVYNCLNPPYHRWQAEWPPLAANLLAAAEAGGAVLVTISNLYGYGPVPGPMTEDLPLAAPGPKGRVRAKMYEDALAAHRAGRVRMVEVRASDYLGPGAESVLLARAFPRLLAGRSVSVIGAADVPHTFTYTGDVAALAVAAAFDADSHGRAWHTPSHPPRTQREVIADLAEVVGVDVPRVSVVPNLVVRAGGLFVPLLRELQETRYQFVKPFVMDSTAAQEHFALAPTPWREILEATVAWYR